MRRVRNPGDPMGQLRTAATRCVTAVLGSLVFAATLPADDGQTAKATSTAASVSSAKSNRGALGVYLGESSDGPTVIGLVPGGSAEQCGIRLGDVIQSVNGRHVQTSQELTSEVGSHQAGVRLQLQIRRDGKPQFVQTQLGGWDSTFSARNQLISSTTDARQSNTTRSSTVQASSTTISAQPAPPATNERLQTLEQQINFLQREIDQLRKPAPVVRSAPATVPQYQASDIDAWLDRHRRGETNSDPSLFQ